MIKPVIPRWAQIRIRRFFVRRALPALSTVWPISAAAGVPPKGWTGWPGGKQFALVLTHDVEGERGVRRCRRLAQMEMELGFTSSYNFLLRKYSTPDELRRYLEENGFEVGIHGLYHDGKKFNSRGIFNERAEVINRYLEKWGCSGFRAPSMQCDLEWIGSLDIEYDLSTFDTDPFEPHSIGVETVFPFIVPRNNGREGFVELPYTLPQDSTLFILLGEKDTDIWKKKLNWIAEVGGMALLNVHPDYMAFDNGVRVIDEYPSRLYEDMLRYIKENYENRYYHCLPREMARFIAESAKKAT